MMWVFAAVVLLCAILFPRFRKVLLGITVLLVGIVAVFYLSEASEQAASKKRIALSEIELADVGLKLDSAGASYTITGRVRNRSARYTLSGFALRIPLEDCLNETTFDVVRQDNEWAFVERVPPRQARDFEILTIDPDNLHFKGKLRWNYRLVETRGRE
jgi:hypothetical protein